jgi:hypothetical protein
MLQPFDPMTFEVPTFNHQWKIVERATSFRADGTAVKVRTRGVHVVQIAWPRVQRGPKTFNQLPVEIRLTIWEMALPGEFQFLILLLHLVVRV